MHLLRRRSGSGNSFRETFRNRKRSGSAEFLFTEIRNAYDPSSRFITTWEQLILACILFELLLVLYLATFNTDSAPSLARFELVGMYLCELVFCADIYVQLNTGYYENGNVLRDTRKSRIKYLKSPGFVMDLLALPPLSLLPVHMHHSVVFLEFHKFIRVRRLPQLISNLDNIYARYFVPLKLIKVLGITLLTSHFVACGRFSFGYDTHHNDHWLPEVPEHEQSDRTKYLMSLFWAFGLLTGLLEGELPHTNAEFAFTIFVGLCGFSMFTYLCATFFMLSKCESGDSETAEARVNQFKHILAFHRVPDKLQAQAVEYLKRYYTQAEANDREAARLLCPSISSDIQIELLQDTVAQIPVFEGCDTHFIKAATSLLELISCPAHFVLFRAGDHGDAMYVVNSGVLYTVVNGVKVRELRKGSFFGEVAVLAKLPRSATMMTTTYSTLYRLSRFHVDKLLEGYPRYARLISQTVDKMLKKANTRDEDKISEIASAGIAPASKKKKKSMLLQVMAMKTDQAVWRNKRSISSVRPDSVESPSSSARSDTSSIKQGGFDKQVTPTDANYLNASKKLPDYSSVILITSAKENAVKTSSTVDPVGPPASFSGSRPRFQKVHPSSDANSQSQRAAIHRSPTLLFGSNSLFRESKKKLELFRGSFFRKGKVGPDDGKPQDVIRGFYDQLPQTAPPPPPSKHWWMKLLLKRCIDAESRARMVWLLFLQLALCYNWISIPLQLAFPLLDDHIPAIAILNIAVDSLSWIDIYLNFNLSYSLNSEKIMEPVRSAKRYFRSWDFVLDLWCNWPYGMFGSLRFNSAAIRLPRLFRVWRLKGHFTEVESYTLMNSRKRLLFFGLILIMLYHIVACLHFSITHWEGFSHHEEAWIPSDDISMTQINSTHFMDIHGEIYASNDPKIVGIGAMQYFRSLYYAANVLAALGKTIEPDSDRQYAVALGFMLSGFLITAIVVDNVQQRFTASAFEQKEFFATRTRIQLFLKRQNAPLTIHQRVNSFLDFWWSSHRGAIIQELLEELPTAIKHDIVKSICTPAAETLALLRVEAPFRASASNEIPEEVRSQLESILLENLRFILYGQGEIIYRLGDYAGGLYFVLEGRVSVMPDGGFPYTVPLGGFFGTAALHLHDVDSEKMAAEGSGGTIAVGYAEHATAVSGCIVIYVSREHLLAMESIFPSLPISLHVLERKLQLCKVSRTSELETIRPGPPVNSPTLQRAILGSLAPEIDSTSIWCKLWTNLIWRTRTSFDPDSRFVGFWETWIFFAMTAQWLIVIYHTCFGVHVAQSSTSSVYVRADTATIVLESSFVIDMYLQSRLGYYEYGNKVMDIETIKSHYFHSTHFLVDMVAIIPLFVLNWLKRDVQSRVELLNVNKLIRIYKAPSHLKSLEGKYVKLAKEFRLFKLVYYTFLASHLFGCIWFDFAANTSGLHSTFNSHEHSNATTYFGENSWLPSELLEGGDRSLQYFGSIFWAFGLMSASNTGELPKTVMQCLFSVVTMTGGFFLFAYVVGNFLDVIELEDSENREFVAKMSSLRHLLAHFKLPQDIQEKFKTYFFFKRFHSITQEHVLERVLPPSLLVDIRMFQLHSMIIKVAFLAGMEDSVTRMLVSLFTQILYVKDEYICRFGEEGSEMFFIFTGTLDILIPAALLTGAPVPPSPAPATAAAAPQRRTTVSKGSISGLQKVNEITAGSYFGEAALFTNAPRNAFVKAKTSCILYRLSRQSLELVFDRYPEWKKKVLRIVKIQQEQQRLTRQATEVQQENDAGGVRRKCLKRNLSRMDLLNSRAEGIEELLLTHTRGDKKKSLAFSMKQALQKYNLLQWLHDKSAPAAAKIRALVALLVNGADIQSRFYILWVRLTSVCTVFIAVFVPYRVAYDSLDRWNGIPVLLRVVECLCEFVFWWDIWFNFRVRANQAAMELYEQDHLLTYKRERFIWDLVAAFPLDYFIGGFVFKQENVILKKWLRLNRCLKMKNFVYYRNEIKRRSVSFEIDRVKTLWLLYSITIFWTSCAYFAVAMHDGFGTEWQAWLPAEELAIPDPEPDVLMLRLFRGLAFATTAFVKKGKTFSPTKTLDFAFSILISFVGQLIMASMIGEMANVFILYIDNEVRFRKNHITAEHYLARWKVSNALKLRANAFLTSWWSSYAGVDYQMVFDDLPRSVRTEGILHIAEKPLLLLMERVFRPLSRGAEKENNSGAVAQGVMHSIAQNLRFEGYPRGENVVVEGSVCKAMYFVVRGYLFSKSASNPSLYHAGRFRMGDYFGENGILGHSVSLMTVTSIRASDLFVLDSERLLEIIKAHPYFQLVYKLAQDVVRQKKSVNKYFADAQVATVAAAPSENKKSAETTLSSRRISAPIVGMRQQQALSKDISGGVQKPVGETSARISTFEAHLSKLLRVNNESEWDSAFRLFVEMILPNGTLNDLDGRPKHSASGGEQEQENGSQSLHAADSDSSFSIRTRRAQSIAATGFSGSAAITSSSKASDTGHAKSNTSPEIGGGHLLSSESDSADVTQVHTAEHETQGNTESQANDVALAKAQKARLHVATLHLQKVMYAGGNRHELLQEANAVAEDSDEDKEDGDDDEQGDRNHKNSKR